MLILWVIWFVHVLSTHFFGCENNRSPHRLMSRTVPPSHTLTCISYATIFTQWSYSGALSSTDSTL